MESVLKVEGLMCTHCKARVEEICKAIPGTENAVADLAANTVTITGCPDMTAVKKAIAAANYTVVE